MSVGRCFPNHIKSKFLTPDIIKMVNLEFVMMACMLSRWIAFSSHVLAVTLLMSCAFCQSSTSSHSDVAEQLSGSPDNAIDSFVKWLDKRGIEYGKV